MKKTKFYISGRHNGKAEARLVNGYVETINGLPIGIHKTPAGWNVSELSTGLKFTEGRTRAEAMNKALEMLDYVSDVIKRDIYDNARKMISAAYGM